MYSQLCDIWTFVLYWKIFVEVFSNPTTIYIVPKSNLQIFIWKLEFESRIWWIIEILTKVIFWGTFTALMFIWPRLLLYKFDHIEVINVEEEVVLNLDEIVGNKDEEVLPVQLWWVWGILNNCIEMISCLLYFPKKAAAIVRISIHTTVAHLMCNDDCHGRVFCGSNSW